VHRAQIYFEQDLFQQIKQISAQNSQSMSAYIREVLRSEIERKKATTAIDVSGVSGMWGDYDISQKTLRDKVGAGLNDLLGHQCFD